MVWRDQVAPSKGPVPYPTSTMSRASSASSSSCAASRRVSGRGGGGGGGSCGGQQRLSVADVYDMAADIGKEFEVVIDSHGPDHISGLMQKVISALEHLERFAADADEEEEAMEQLRSTVAHLEREEAKKNEERQRVTKELEQIEEHYKQETRDLLSTVKRLQDENRKLSSSLAAATERDSAFSEDGEIYIYI